MENQETKALADLIQDPSEISAIVSDPAEKGVQFYQALPNKEKQYVIFAAALGLFGYGLYLNRMSKNNSSPKGTNAPKAKGQ